MSDRDETRREWRISTTPRGGFVSWRPGLALPLHWQTRLEAEHLPYTVELDFEADKHGPACRSIRLIARDGAPPIGARTVRGVPVQECINTAIGAAAVREEHRPGVKVITFGGGSRDVTEQHTLAAQMAPRMTDEHLREVADIYSRALEKPTRAVHDHFAPVSYSTAARWVSHARQRGFLPPTGRGSAARKKD